MGPELSRRTLDRPKQTIHAAELFHVHAPEIAQACEEASPNEVVVAVVEWNDMLFDGCRIVPKEEIKSCVQQLEGQGWALIFAPRTSREDVEERALRMARLAFRRWETLLRWGSRQG